MIDSWYVMSVIAAVLLGGAFWWRRKTKARNETRLDLMDDAAFERYLALLFARLGYQIKRTNYAGHVRTLVATKNGISYVIQARRNHRRVGAKAIEDVMSSRSYYKCERAMVVTNHFFSKKARQKAKANRIVILDRHDLIKELVCLEQNRPVSVDGFQEEKETHS